MRWTAIRKVSLLATLLTVGGVLATTPALAATDTTANNEQAETTEAAMKVDETGQNFFSVWVAAPAGSTISLAGPAGFVYTIFNDQGEIIKNHGEAGDQTLPITSVLISTRPNTEKDENGHFSVLAGTYYQIGDNQYIKSGAGVDFKYGDAPKGTTTATLNYSDDANPATPLRAAQAVAISDYRNADFKAALMKAAPKMTGYAFKQAAWNDDSTALTYTYQLAKQPDPDPTPTPTPQPEPELPTTPLEPSIPGNPSTPVAVKGEAIYAVKRVGLYRNVAFTNGNRQLWYPKQSRTKRPQFVVTGYAKTKAGTLRYKVREINYPTRTGYLTANPAYVKPLYYQGNPKTVRVINAKGVNGYTDVNLTGKVHHYRRGATLKVRAIQKYHLTTRLLLTNGQYVTANKTLVIQK